MGFKKLVHAAWVIALAWPVSGSAQNAAAVSEEHSRGWRSISTAYSHASSDRWTQGIRVAYQPLAPADRPPALTAPPSTSLPGSSVPLTPPSVTAPGTPGSAVGGTMVAPSSPSVVGAQPRTSTVVPPGTCGYEPYRAAGVAPGTTVGFQPLLPIVSMPGTVYIARGIFGQPVVYVPGQPVRNFLRYLGP